MLIDKLNFAAVILLVIGTACRSAVRSDEPDPKDAQSPSAATDSSESRSNEAIPRPAARAHLSAPAVGGGNIDVECDLKPEYADYLDDLARTLFGDTRLDPFAVCDESVRVGNWSWGIGFVAPSTSGATDDGLNSPKQPWKLILAQYDDVRLPARGRPKPKIVHYDIDIDSSSATVLEHAWRLIVRRARQPRPTFRIDEDGSLYETRSLMADGIPYGFSSGSWRGATNVPKGGYADAISRLARGLRGVVLARPEDRAEDLKRWVELAQYLIDRIDSRPW